MWPSQQSWNWNSVDVGPHRDLLLETLTAARQVGLRAGIYFSLFAWFHPLYLRDPALYVEQVMYPQWMDLIDNYQPDVLWCDGDWEQNSTLWRATDFLAYLYNDSPVKDSIVVNDRFGSDARGHHGGFLTSEYSSTIYERKWEENSGIDIFSFGLNRQTPVEKYYTAAYLVNLLLRTVSNGGNFLLNVGPRSDGTIPTIMQERLLQIGDWLSVNGEGIYGSSRWKVAQEGQIDNTTVRYTQSKDGSVIFAFVLDWPEDNRVTLRAVNRSSGNASVTLLGWTASRLVWSKLSGGGGILVSLPYVTPSTLPCMYVWTLKLLGFSG